MLILTIAGVALAIIIAVAGACAKKKYKVAIQNINDTKSSVENIKHSVDNIQAQLDTFRNDIENINKRFEEFSKSGKTGSVEAPKAKRTRKAKVVKEA